MLKIVNNLFNDTGTLPEVEALSESRMIEEQLKAAIRDVPDFPKEGIVFKDITPIMLDPKLSEDVVEHLANMYRDKGITKIAGIESRGFLFGYPLAMRLGLPFILIRKAGKLPYHKISHSYELE